MTKTSIIIILIALALVVLAVGAFSYMRKVSTEGLPDETPEDNSEEPLKTEQLHVETVNTDYVALSAAAPAVQAGATIQQTLTATVYPATATNKLVDWSVSWGDPSNTQDVSNYITVTPASNGSTTATVTCYQPFFGNIVITVTTRESGYTAECIVTYGGRPTDILVESNVAAQADGYHIGVGNAYTFSLSAVNPFGEVGGTYKVELGAVGTVKLGYKEVYSSSGNTNWYDNTLEDVALSTLKDNFLTVSCTDNVVTVNTLKSIESYYESMERQDSGRTKVYNNAFHSYVNDCYFEVKITEQISGVTKTLKIRFDDTVVTGVDVDQNSMVF